MNAPQPLVSVVMPVYNCVRYLHEAVDSILHQTLGDIELIIVDDGSTDGSWELLQTLRDPRVRLLRQRNAGAYAARNRGIESARAAFIASMDADDVSAPDRLRMQYTYLLSHPDVAMVGSWYICFGAGQEQRFRAPIDDYQIKYALFNENVFAGGDVMIRAEVLRLTGPYREFYADDYDLWLRISEISRVAILPFFLYRYRRHDGQITSRMGGGMHQDGQRAVRLALQRYLHGKDSLGYMVPASYGLRSLLTTYQAFALHALCCRSLHLSVILLKASLVRDWQSALFAAMNPAVLRFSVLQLAHAAGHCVSMQILAKRSPVHQALCALRGARCH